LKKHPYIPAFLFLFSFKACPNKLGRKKEDGENMYTTILYTLLIQLAAKESSAMYLFPYVGKRPQVTSNGNIRIRRMALQTPHAPGMKSRITLLFSIKNCKGLHARFTDYNRKQERFPDIYCTTT
jgi:hypothetical protein